MGLLKKLMSGMQAARPRTLVEIQVNDAVNGIPEVIYWTSAGDELRIIVPTAKLRTWGAFGFADGWNPMMPPLQDDFQTFSEFYQSFRPRDLSDMYFLEENFGTVGLGPMTLPWLALDTGQKASGKQSDRLQVGLAREPRFFGPATSETIKRQFERTRRVMRSIRQKGYQPDRYGDIQGYFLRFQGDYRFVVKGGKHRATVLAHMGLGSVPVCLRPGWPRVIEGDRAREWPLVRAGQIGEDYAMALMRRFFEFDGTQQRDRIFSGSRHASFSNTG